MREQILKDYPGLFKKKVVTRVKGKIVSSKIVEMEPIITEGDACWYVQNHKDASPLILSKSYGQ